MEQWIRVRDGAQFFDQINLHARGFDSVRSAVGREDFTAALREYRHLLSDRLPQRKGNPGKNFMQKADFLLENKLSLLGSPLIDIGDPIDWLLCPGGDKQWQSHLGYFYYTDVLLDAYDATGEEKYLNKWMKIYSDFLQNHPWGVPSLEYDEAIPVYLNEMGYKYGGEGRTPGYIGGSWIGLAAATRTIGFLSALGRVIENSNVPDVFVANVLYSLVTDHCFVLLNNPRRYTPNQLIHCAVALIYIGRILNEFKIAPAAYFVGMDRLEEALETCILPDGSDPEQSFGYNAGIVGNMIPIKEMFHGIHNQRIEKLLHKVGKRCFFLAAIVTPLNRLPSVAKTHSGNDELHLVQERNKSFPVAAVEEMIRASDAGAPCSFTSVAFPYGGYYVFRSGWTREDSYLLLKTSRYAMGHAHEDCNSLVLTAFGHDLLIDSGNYNYANDSESERINHYFFSSFAHNTLCVENRSQTRLDTVAVNRDKVSEDWESYEAYATHLRGLSQRDGTRYYLGETLQFAEGIYADGYGADRLNVTHHRQLISFGNRCYAVIDRVSGGESHQLNWILSPDCERAAIEGNTVSTKAGQVHFTILHLGADCNIQSHCGSEEPLDGWECPNYNQKIPTEHIAVCYGEERLMVSILIPYEGVCPDIKILHNNQEMISVTLDDRLLQGELEVTLQQTKATVTNGQAQETVILPQSGGRFYQQSGEEVLF